MKTIIAVEIDIDPNDELKCEKCMALNTNNGTLHYCEIPQLGPVPVVVNGNRLQKCLDAGTAMMLKTHCKGAK